MIEWKDFLSVLLSIFLHLRCIWNILVFSFTLCFRSLYKGLHNLHDCFSEAYYQACLYVVIHCLFTKSLGYRTLNYAQILYLVSLKKDGHEFSCYVLIPHPVIVPGRTTRAYSFWVIAARYNLIHTFSLYTHSHTNKRFS